MKILDGIVDEKSSIERSYKSLATYLDPGASDRINPRDAGIEGVIHVVV